MRIQSAELALQQLQRRQVKLKAQGLVLTKEKATEEEPPRHGADHNEDETDEERSQRLEEEDKEQRKLIGYDPQAGTFTSRWRSDFKCGDRVPGLPDGGVVECEPSGEAPCCSSLGWCGKSRAHCNCEMCEDYRSKAQMEIKKVRLLAESRECDSIAENLGEQPSPEACAQLVMDAVECGRSFMMSKAYPSWGCRCCAAMSGVGDEVKQVWDVYTIDVNRVDKPSITLWRAKPTG